MPAAKKRALPKVGAELTKNYKHKTYRMTVVKTADGLGYEVGGSVYSSPSMAAKSITKNEINGWKFWNLD